MKSFASCGTLTNLVQAGAVQLEQLITSTNGASHLDLLNPILTPPLVSGKVRSQTLATPPYSRCTLPTPPPCPSLYPSLQLDTPSLRIMPVTRLLQPSPWLSMVTQRYPLERMQLHCSLRFVQRLPDSLVPLCSHPI